MTNQNFQSQACLYMADESSAFWWVNGKKKMFLTHALMCTRGFYNFLSALGTCINFLVFQAGELVSIEEKTHLYSTFYFSSLPQNVEDGCSLVMRTDVPTKCSQVSVHSPHSSVDCCPLVSSPRSPGPAPGPAASSENCTAYALLDGGKDMISFLGSETDRKQGHGFCNTRRNH